MTPAQLTALRANILLDPALAAMFNSPTFNSDDAFAIAAAYNLDAAPNFFVWRTRVPINEIMSNGFDWTRVDNLTVGKARIWEWMTDLGAINLAEPNVRAGVEACFSVAVGDQPNRMAIYSHGQRLATRAEKLFATGAGTTTNDHGAGPATMTFEGQLQYSDVQAAKAAA